MATIDLQSITKTLDNADSFIALEQQLHKLAQDFDLVNYAYTLYVNTPQQGTELQYEYSSKGLLNWHNYFHQQNYEGIDAIGMTVKKSIVPVYWDLHAALNEATGREKLLYEDAIEHGLATGVSIPVHSQNNTMAILVVHHKAIKQLEEKHPELVMMMHVAALHYTQRVIELSLLTGQSDEGKSLLTPRERSCLRLTAEGKTAKQVADFIGISERTVNFHIANTTAKLQVKGKHQAVQEASKLGLID